MNRVQVFETETIELAAFLATVGHEPTIYCKPGNHRATFNFAESTDLRDAIIAFERGASLPAKKLLSCRAWLFREASRVVREGRQ